MENFLQKIEIKEFSINCIQNDLYITRLLKKNIIFGENYEFLFKILIDENTDVIDCGAYIGTVTMLMSRYVSNNNFIHSFEPTFYEILIKNIIENNIIKAKAYSIGLSDSDFYIESFNINLQNNVNYGSFLYKIRDDEKIREDEILPDKKYLPFHRLDYFNLTNISFIKIDVEFNEQMVLSGGINTLINNNYPSIFIELFVIENKNIEKHLEIIKDNTFHCFSLLSLLGYVCIPIVASDGDFLFIHNSKQDKIEKVLNYINNNEIVTNEYYVNILNTN